MAKRVTTKSTGAKEELKLTKIKKSATWNQQVDAAYTDLNNAKSMGVSSMSLLASRLTAISPNVKSAQESNLVKPRLWFPTSLLPIDYVFGKGKGIPSGAVIEFYGPEQGGKTTSLLAIAGDLQKRYGSMLVWADSEASTDNSTLKRANIMTDPEHLMLLDPGKGHIITYDFVFRTFVRVIHEYAVLEDALQEGETLPPLIIGWDSVGGTSPVDIDMTSDTSGVMTSGKLGLSASQITYAMRIIKGLIRSHNIIFLACNQQRAVISMSAGPMARYGDTEKPAGGHNWAHEVDIRMRVRHRNPWGANYANGSTRITSGDDILGHLMYIENRKNKCSAPFRAGTLINIFDVGVDIELCNVLHAAFDLPNSCLTKGRGRSPYVWREFTGTLPELVGRLREDQEMHKLFQEDVRSVQANVLGDPSLPSSDDADDESEVEENAFDVVPDFDDVDDVD